MMRTTTKISRQADGELNVMKCHSTIYEQTGILSPKLLRYRGVVLVWTAILLMLMILMIGLALDTAKVAFNVHELQNAADAAALAGALVVKGNLPDISRQRACEIGLANATAGLAVTLRTTPSPQEDDPFPEDDSSYDIIVGRWVRYNHTFLPTLDAPNAVRVIARRNTALAEEAAPALGLNFGPIVGVDTVNASREAIAFCNSSGGAGLIVLSSEPTQGLDLGGGPIIDIDGGGIHVNSTSLNPSNNSAAAWVTGNTVLDAGFLNVVGTVSPPPDDSSWEKIFEKAQAAGEAGAYPVMDYMDGIQHIDDPLAAAMLAEPEPYVVPYLYMDDPDKGPGARLDLPNLLVSGDIPTWYLSWDEATSTYSYSSTPIPGFTATVGQDNGGGNVSAIVTLLPGYYPNGMSLSNGDDVTLEPGLGTSRADKLFLFGGGTKVTNSNVGLYMTGGSLIGEGVTCYVTQTFDSTGSPLPNPVSGLIEITGGHLDIVSPGDQENRDNGSFDPLLVEGLNGIAIWQDPDIPGPPEAFFRGNGDFTVAGTIYFPDPIHLRLAGDLGDTGNQVLCGTAEISGTSHISVNYDGRNFGNSTVRCYLVR